MLRIGTTRLAITKRQFSLSAKCAYAPGSHQHDDDPEHIEFEKKRVLAKETPTTHTHAPGWSEPLASDSEAYIKAEQAEGIPNVEATIEHIKIRYTPGNAKESKENPDISHTNADYEKEEVGGPLGSQAKKEQGNPREKPAVPTGSEEAVKADRNE